MGTPTRVPGHRVPRAAAVVERVLVGSRASRVGKGAPQLDSSHRLAHASRGGAGSGSHASSAWTGGRSTARRYG